MNALTRRPMVGNDVTVSTTLIGRIIGVSTHGYHILTPADEVVVYRTLVGARIS